MKFAVTVDGKPVEIDLAQNGDGWELDGRALSVLEVEAGIYSVLLDGRSYQVRVESAQQGWAVSVGGRRFVVEVTDPRQIRRNVEGLTREGRAAVAAPMPGKVVRVLVAEGEMVEAGQGLLVVEAMKMQNEMKAPKAGRIASLRAEPGRAVSAGEVLVTIE